MCHSYRILGAKYPGRLHETDYYLNKLDEKKMENRDLLWLPPFELCVLVQLPVTIQYLNERGGHSRSHHHKDQNSGGKSKF